MTGDIRMNQKMGRSGGLGMGTEWEAMGLRMSLRHRRSRASRPAHIAVLSSPTSMSCVPCLAQQQRFLGGSQYPVGSMESIDGYMRVWPPPLTVSLSLRVSKAKECI